MDGFKYSSYEFIIMESVNICKALAESYYLKHSNKSVLKSFVFEHGIRSPLISAIWYSTIRLIHLTVRSFHQLIPEIETR